MNVSQIEAARADITKIRDLLHAKRKRVGAGELAPIELVESSVDAALLSSLDGLSAIKVLKGAPLQDAEPCICAFCDDVRVLIGRAEDVLSAPANGGWRHDLQARMAAVFDAITSGQKCVRA